eukprot:jgi/Chrzof1/407/Cz01g14210.t1
MAGYLHKLQGAVAFPLVLDLSPFTMSSQSCREVQQSTMQAHSNWQSYADSSQQTRGGHHHSQLLYDLVAVVQHLGGHNSGHYLVYRMLHTSQVGSKDSMVQATAAVAATATASVPSAAPALPAWYTGSSQSISSDVGDANSCWVMVSDNQVTAVTVQQVLTCQAALLLYERHR